MDETWPELLDAYLRLHHDTLGQIRREWDGLQLGFLDRHASARFRDKFLGWRERSRWPFQRMPEVTLVAEAPERVTVELDGPRSRLTLVRRADRWRLSQALAPPEPKKGGAGRWRPYFDAQRQRMASYRTSPAKAAAVNAASLLGRARSSWGRVRRPRALPIHRRLLHDYLRLYAAGLNRLSRRWHDEHDAFLSRHADPSLVDAYRAFWRELETLLPEPTFPSPRLLRSSRGRATVALADFLALRAVPGRPTLPIRLEVSFVEQGDRWLIDDAELPRPMAG